MVKKYFFDKTREEHSINLKPGVYRFHCWGASGGYLELNGSRGAYISGLLELKEERRFFIYVGEKGVVKGTQETFNGGGKSSYTEKYFYPQAYSSSGGGGTDIRLIGGNWNDFESLKSRIIVAGGGGGETNFIIDDQSKPALGGSAGIFEAELANFSEQYNANNNGAEFPPTTGGNQKEGGKCGGSRGGTDGTFGKGGNGELWSDFAHSSGAGGGYFGGGGAGITSYRLGCGSGGSSFLSGIEGFSAISNESIPSQFYFNGSIHYSGLYFTKPVLHSGHDYFISPYGYLEKGHSGDGAVLIEQLNIFITCYKKRKILNQISPLIIFVI